MNKILLIVLCTFLLLLCLSYKATEKPKSECKIAKGTVKNIFEGGIKDVVFELQGHKLKYYINRGLENGFSLEQLNMLSGKEVLIYYPDTWTIMAPFGTSCKHIRELRVNGSVVYSEFK